MAQLLLTSGSLPSPSEGKPREVPSVWVSPLEQYAGEAAINDYIQKRWPYVFGQKSVTDK